MLIMGKRWNKRKQKMIDIANERIDILFRLSKEQLEKKDKNDELSRRYIQIARKISMKIRTPLKWEYNRQICKKCNSLLVPGYNSRTRLQGKKKNAHMIVTCLNCGNVKRFHYHR